MFRSLDAGAIGVSAPFEQVVAWAAEFEFEGVSIPINLAVEQGPNAVKDPLERHGIKPSVFGLPVDFRNDRAAFERDIGKLPVEAEAAAQVGLSRCSTWVLPGRKGMSESDYFDELKERLGECAWILHHHGIRLGFEYIGPKTLRKGLGLETDGLSNAERMLELVDAIGLPGTGLLLDSWHWYTAGDTPDLFEHLDNSLVVDVHTNDAPKGIPVDEQIDSVRELPGATGVIDLEAFFAGLEKINYDGPVMVEPFHAELNAMDDREAIAQAAEALEKFL